MGNVVLGNTRAQFGAQGELIVSRDMSPLRQLFWGACNLLIFVYLISRLIDFCIRKYGYFGGWISNHYGIATFWCVIGGLVLVGSGLAVFDIVRTRASGFPDAVLFVDGNILKIVEFPWRKRCAEFEMLSITNLYIKKTFVNGLPNRREIMQATRNGKSSRLLSLSSFSGDIDDRTAQAIMLWIQIYNESIVLGVPSN